jgi:hypothetical protein
VVLNDLLVVTCWMRRGWGGVPRTVWVPTPAAFSARFSQTHSGGGRHETLNQAAKQETVPANVDAPATSALPFELPDKTPIAPDAPKDARMKKVFDALEHLNIPCVETPATRWWR